VLRFGFIGDLLRWLLDTIYNFIPNYGIAILIFVLIIRMLLMPFEVKSRRGMKKMAELQPKMAELEKKYAKDKDRLSQKMGELYRKEKASPLSGCLPMLLTFPILFAMFAVMREVANEKTIAMVLEIKNQLEMGNTEYRPVLEGFLWIKNVFQPDSFMSTVIPEANERALMAVTAYGSLTQEMIDEAKAFLLTPAYAEWAAAYGNTTVYSAPLLFWRINIPAAYNGLFLLPILTAVAQFLTSKIMSAGQPQMETKKDQTDSQKFMQWFFPLFSLWICATSNAGFALYWVAANIIQIVQQLLINKWIDFTDNRNKLNEEANKL